MSAIQEEKEKSKKIISALLKWYQKNKRDLPWRHTKDPYSIWISEIMLQQTQVDTVIPYYHRFLKAFPNIQSLAQAKESEVLSLWSGLGYYSRAKNLQKAAIQIMQEHAGVFPQDSLSILNLPGIGRYTLGAIGSIAFNLDLALVDGNVMRVYARLFKIVGSPSDKKFVNQIWELAESFITLLSSFHSPSYGDFNQALMELGASLCSPKNPSCLICPLRELCSVVGKNPENYPAKKKKIKTEKLVRFAFVLRSKNEVLLCKNPHRRWQKNLWHLPDDGWLKVEEKETKPEKIVNRCKKLFNQSLETEWKVLEPHRHVITHHQIQIYPFEIEVENKGLKLPFSKWYPLNKVFNLALPAPDKKILQLLK